MPKPQYILKSETIPTLLDELQRVTKCRLQTHSDSIRLAEILNAHGYQISPHTLSRLAGFFHSKTKPYLYNINALAQFLNYRDVYDFEEVSCGKVNENNIYNIVESRALLSFEKNNATQFVDYYSSLMPLTPPHVRLNHIMATEFRSGTPRGTQILKAIEKSEKARMSYFHHFVDEDNQGNYFLHSIERVYAQQRISSHEKAFYEEYAFNKYYEQKKVGAIPLRKFKGSYKNCVKAEHREFAHLYSRLFVNYLYAKYEEKRFKKNELEALLEAGIQHAIDTNYAPFRIAWLGRLVRAFLFIGAEDVLRNSSEIKQQIEWSMTTNIVDYEFQSILQMEGLRLGVVTPLQIKSFKGGWYSALLTSSAWDLLSGAHCVSDNTLMRSKMLTESKEIAQIIDNKLFYEFVEKLLEN